MAGWTARTTASSAARSPALARPTAASRSSSRGFRVLSFMPFEQLLQRDELLGKCARLRVECPFELLERHRRRRQDETKDAPARRGLHDSRERRRDAAI